MKSLKKVLCIALAVGVISGSAVFPAGASGTIAYGTGNVSASALNIRSGPGTDNSVISTVGNGSTVVILERSTDDWYKINYNGTIGYVSSAYLTGITQVENFDAVGKVNDSGVRYRSAPSTDGSVVGTLSSGTEVKIIGLNNGWYKITVSGNTGYMRSDYVDIVAKGSGSSSGTSSETTEESSSTGKPGTVNADYVRFRTGPSTSYSIISTLNKGTQVSILGQTDGWYKIVYSGTSGYMSSSYVSEGSESSSSSSSSAGVEAMDTNGYVSGSYVRFRSGPSTSYSIISTLSYGTSVHIVGKTSGWYKITYNGTTGYMSSDYVKTGDVPSASSESNSLGVRIADYAKQYVGYRYVYGGASPSSGFDCSGLMYYVYGQFGYSIQRGAGSQYAYSGKNVTKAELQPGDLVFFSSNGFASVTHVGMYIGNGQFVHACDSDHGVIISDLNCTHYTRQFYGAKRII